ncbi:MAG: Gmad2 immunoglobulin-like domain-containing protein [Tumebacillaceae bacterium]
MSKSSKGRKGKNRVALGIAVIVTIVAAGSLAYNLYSNHADPVTSPPEQSEPVKPNEPTKQPEPVKSDDAQTNTPQPAPQPQNQQQPPAQQPAGSTVITFPGYTGSGSLSLKDRNLSNNSFQIERIDWSESNKSVTISGKMRAFEAVGSMRVLDEQKQIVEPERPVRAAEGAPSWSPIQVSMPLTPEYKGKTLTVEFYVKSAKDGSKTDILKVEIKPE